MTDTRAAEPAPGADPAAPADGRTRTPIIDTDVHEMIGNPFDFLKYVDEPWRSRIHPDNWMGISIPYSWPTVGGLARPDARPANGMRAGSDYQLMREQHLDALDIDYAVLTGLLYPGEFKVQPDFAAGLAHAYNDWLIGEWLVKDDRFLGSVCVAAQNPAAAVEEIERVGSQVSRLKPGVRVRVPFNFADGTCPY